MRRWGWVFLAWVLVLAGPLAAVAAAGPAGRGGAVPAAGPPGASAGVAGTPAGPAGGYRVDPPFLRDRYGRAVFFHGVNAVWKRPPYHPPSTLFGAPP